MFKQLIIVLIISFVVIGGAEAKNVEQQGSSVNCPGYCKCSCKFTTNGDPICLPCLPERTNDGGNDRRVRQTFPDDLIELIEQASNKSSRELIGLLFATLQSQLMPFLQSILTGNSTLEGVLIPFADILNYIVVLILLILRSLRLLGLLGLGICLKKILKHLGGLG